MDPERAELLDEWSRMLSTGIIRFKDVRKYRNYPKSLSTTPCRSLLEAYLFGIPGSELGKNLMLVPAKLDVGKLQNDQLLEAAILCDQHAEMLESKGYSVATRVSRERAEYYRSQIAQSANSGQSVLPTLPPVSSKRKFWWEQSQNPLRQETEDQKRSSLA